MSVIKDVLKEEHDRLKRLKTKYTKEIQILPKGAITKKARNNKFYLYLTYREKEKVISKYIGNWESEKVKSVIKQIEKRKVIENNLKKVYKNLQELERVLNGNKI